MSTYNFLDKTGLGLVWGKIKALIPTKTSDLTNDSGYITDAGVTSFNGSTGAITYTAPVTSVNGDTGAVTISVPTKTSDLNNDSGYITDAGVTSFNGNTGAITYTAPVTSVNSKTGVVSLTASDVGALPSSTSIPTKTSDLTNDSGFITTDTNTTYTISISNNRITLTPSSGTASYIDLPVYDGGVSS